MSTVVRESSARRHSRLRIAIKSTMREMNIQLSLLNRRVGARVELSDGDLSCLDLIGRAGPFTPSSLARATGLHPATVTGVLDRLERGGWIARDRDPADRRAVQVRAIPKRSGELVRLFGGMNRSLDDICKLYDVDQLEVIADFLRRTTEAGRSAKDELAGP
jgi:DNA-binding MarR family transcriptional regulator